jgi:hypothetical protein
MKKTKNNISRKIEDLYHEKYKDVIDEGDSFKISFRKFARLKERDLAIESK